MENKIQIYTDGSCLGNPGPGGWGAVLIHKGKEKHISGSEPDTTNNRMEMMAIIKALEFLHQHKIQDRDIVIYSDSSLVINTFTKGWKRKANTDLWSELNRLTAWLNISWNWVKGHSTNKYNNLADELAVKAAETLRA